MPYNILVAEDNEFTLKQYKITLEKNGHKAILTKDGEQCVEVFNQANRQMKLLNKNHFSTPFNIVLLDHDMPKSTGVEAARQIFKINPYQRIVFLSAYGKRILDGFSKDKMAIPQIIQKPFSLNFLARFLEAKLMGYEITGKYG